MSANLSPAVKYEDTTRHLKTLKTRLLVPPSRGLGRWSLCAVEPRAHLRGVNERDTAEQRTEPSRIVVGVDGSPSSKTALRWAARLAAATGATIQAVIAWELPQTYGWPVGLDGWRPDVDAAKVVQDAVDEVFGPQRPTGLETVVIEGHPSEVLLGAGKRALMLVVGSRGHGGFAGLLLGSVSAACAEHAHCPVLVVHDD